MLFNTIEFAIFLPIVILAYYLIPHRFRWVLLLAASYYFYMSWKVEYVVLIMASTLVDYFAGIMMEKRPTQRSRIPFLLLSLLINLGLLFSFKYFNFAAENINLAFSKVGIDRTLPMMNVLLPVGISFYTFQTLSYSIEVFLGRQKAERHLGYFALYVSFFPQLVAGPIERYARLAPQFRQKHLFNYENLSKGVRLILYGLFIKMVIADNLAGFVDEIYAAPFRYSSLDILKGLFFFSFQIYSDFYGYSIIAIGSAKIMGINIMDNFKTPYLAKNIAEFWQRWHISLSTWFRDYLYFPLGGNRVKWLRWVMNILVVFLVSGLWHGSNWTFICWGGLFGLIYLAEKAFNKAFHIDKVHKAFSFGHILLALKTFLLVTVIWIFFRSQDLEQAFNIFGYLFRNLDVSTLELDIPLRIWIFLSIFILSDILLYNKRFDHWMDKLPFVARWLIILFLIFSIIVFAQIDVYPFIYFQF